MNVLITAGPTRESIDPVRFISNRSTGKMGYAIAQCALEHDHDVHLVTGPVALSPPEGVRVTQVETAADMLQAVRDHLAWCEVLIMVAAVADWRPANMAQHKVKKHDGPAVIQLERTDDILKSIAPGKGDRFFVGFAAETEHMVAEAQRKLAEKNLDMIVANNVSEEDAGFECDTNRVVLLHRDGATQELPLLPKQDVAEQIIVSIEAKMSARSV